MATLGYAPLIDRFRLPLVPRGPAARVYRAVNRRVDTETEILFPPGVLESRTGRISFFPHPAEGLRETSSGWEAFLNDRERAIDPLIKAACAAFGFVCLHPFMDGNGRLHRLLWMAPRICA